MNEMNLDELKALARKQQETFGREVRVFPDSTVELRANDDGTDFGLVGHAAVFDQETVIGFNWWREKIAKGAFRKTIREADVRHLFNHDPNIVLGRNRAGTLRLREDDIGLYYDVDLNPDDPDAISVGAKVARGDVNQSSFAFIVVRELWEEVEDDIPLRTILEVKLFDTSTVTYPAYETTDAGIRSLTDDLVMRTELLYGLSVRTPSGALGPELCRANTALGELLDTCRRAADIAPTGEPAADEAQDADGPDEPEEADESEDGAEPDEVHSVSVDEALTLRLRHAYRTRVMRAR